MVFHPSMCLHVSSMCLCVHVCTSKGSLSPSVSQSRRRQIKNQAGRQGGEGGGYGEQRNQHPPDAGPPARQDATQYNTNRPTPPPPLPPFHPPSDTDDDDWLTHGASYASHKTHAELNGLTHHRYTAGLTAFIDNPHTIKLMPECLDDLRSYRYTQVVVPVPAERDNDKAWNEVRGCGVSVGVDYT